MDKLLTKERNTKAIPRHILIPLILHGLHQCHLNHKPTQTMRNKNHRPRHTPFLLPQPPQLLQQRIRQPHERHPRHHLRMLIQHDPRPIRLPTNPLPHPRRVPPVAAPRKRPSSVAVPCMQPARAGTRHGDDVDGRSVVRQRARGVEREAKRWLCGVRAAGGGRGEGLFGGFVREGGRWMGTYDGLGRGKGLDASRARRHILISIYVCWSNICASEDQHRNASTR